MKRTFTMSKYMNSEDMYKAMMEYIRELESRNQWVSVEDRLPKENGTYIGLDLHNSDLQDFKHGKLIPASDDISGVYFENGKFIYLVNGCEYEDKISHWMPLPNPVDEHKGDI